MSDHLAPALTATERRVAEIMSRHGARVPATGITGETAMAQDAMIDGIDVDDFVEDLREEFGDVVFGILWLDYSDQRASFRGCGVLVFPAWLVWRLFVRHRGERLIPPPDPMTCPRLTVAHIAAVLDSGEWFEPVTIA